MGPFTSKRFDRKCAIANFVPEPIAIDETKPDQYKIAYQ